MLEILYPIFIKQIYHADNKIIQSNIISLQIYLKIEVYINVKTFCDIKGRLFSTFQSSEAICS